MGVAAYRADVVIVGLTLVAEVVKRLGEEVAVRLLDFKRPLEGVV